MAFDFNNFGTTKKETLKTKSGFDFNSFGNTPDTVIKKETIGNPLFEAKDNESPLTTGLKTTGNVLSSTWNTIKSIGNFLNPLETVKNLKSQAEQIGSDINAPKVSVLDVAKEIPNNLYKMLAPQSLQYLFQGNIDEARKAIENDPIGQIAPYLMVAEGGAKLADTKFGGLAKQAEMNSQNPNINVMPKKGIYENALNTGISKAGENIAKPIENKLTGGKNLVGNLVQSASSYVTGLDKTSIENIIKNPEAFSKIEQDNITRGGIAGEVKTAIDKRLSELSETGKGYENLRKTEGAVQIPQTTIADVLKKYNIELVDGKIKTGVESTPLSPTDINKLQHFVDTFGNETTLSNNAFLNARSALSDLSKYEQGSTGRVNQIARDLRSAYDTQGKAQIKGLKELDAVYSPEVDFLKKIKKDYLNKDGTFKDGAVNKIANSTGKGKENLLARLENVMPGVSKRIQLLKAIEDIEKANGMKAFRYGNLAGKVLAGGAGYAVGGLTGAIVAEIIANPSIAVPLLRGYGYSKAQIAPILQALKAFVGDINNLKTPEAVKNYLKNPKLGMSVEDVSKNQDNILPKTPEIKNAIQSDKNTSILKSSNKTPSKSNKLLTSKK